MRVICIALFALMTVSCGRGDTPSNNTSTVEQLPASAGVRIGHAWRVQRPALVALSFGNAVQSVAPPGPALDMMTISFDRRVSTNDALAEMLRRHLRPATQSETLAFVRKLKSQSYARTNPIVSLGYDGPLLGNTENWPAFVLLPNSMTNLVPLSRRNTWPSGAEFLAVREPTV